jgi:hypothetical protein
VKVTRAVQGSLWAENQKQEDLSRAPDFDMSELESLFSAAAPVSNSVAGDRAGSKRAATKQEKVHLVDLRRANNCEIMLTKVKMPLPDVIVSECCPTLRVFYGIGMLLFQQYVFFETIGFL